MSAPLRMSFDVACSAEHAFTVWTSGIGKHLRRDRADATEVQIHFLAQGDAATRIEIEHRGWERLGIEADAWRDRNRAGWQALLPHLLAAIAKGDS